MPTYTFKDNTTDEVFDIVLSIKDLDSFCEENPNLERYYDEVPGIVSGVSHNSKLSDGFKEVMSKVAESHPSSPLADQYGKRSIRQIKTREAVKRWSKSSD